MAKPGKPQQGSAVKVVEALVRPVVEAMGLRLWDVRFEKEGPDWFLRVLIDRDEPMDTDTCAEVSHAIDPLLDEADPIEGPYCLEVSSAGVSRLLRTDAHLQYAAERGLPVTASAYTPVFAGAKQYTGRIESFDAQTIRFADGPAVERKAVARLEAEC